MKILNFLSVLFTSVLSISVQPTDMKCNCNSPMIMDLYRPVCGQNGITYSNPCSAVCMGHTQVKYYGNCISKPLENGLKCHDGLDNDHDSLVDCHDPDCKKSIFCRNVYNRCNMDSSSSLQNIKKNCCKDSKNCRSVPHQCSLNCAKVFVPFYRECNYKFRGYHKHQRYHKCHDKWGKSCLALANMGDCKKSELSSVLKQNCAKTCGICKPTPMTHPNELRRLYHKCMPVYREEVQINNKYKHTNIPITCTLWNDGCNTCGVNHGKLTYCTRRACFRKGKPHCVKYKGIGVISKKPNSKICNAVGELHVLKSCEVVFRSLQKVDREICHTPCMKKMIQFYNECYNAPNLQNFFKNLDPKLIRPCEEGLIGGKKINNCRLSAGYIWCSPLNKCVRPWLTPCPMHSLIHRG